MCEFIILTLSKGNQKTKVRQNYGKSPIAEKIQNSPIRNFRFLQSKYIINGIQINAFVKIDNKFNKIKIYIGLTKNGQLIRVYLTSTIILTSRYFNTINATMRNAYFSIDPITHHIYLTFENIYSKLEYKKLTKNQEQIDKQVEWSLDVCYYHIQKYLLKVLQIIGQVQINISTISTLKYLKSSKDASSSKFTLQKLQDNKNSSSFKIQNLIAKILIINTSQLKLKTTNPSITELIKHDQQWINQYDRVFIRYLTQPLTKVSNQYDNTKLFSSIHIYSINDMIKDRVTEEHGAYNLSYNIIKFTHYNHLDMEQSYLRDKLGQLNKVPENQKLTKLVSIKSSKRNIQTQSKINHQKFILDTLKNQSSINLIKFYETDQTNFSSKLIMNSYYHRQFDKFTSTNAKTISLFTKIFLLCQLIQGLRLLRDNKIVHLNLKPQNILIGKGLILRVSEFGQAYHPDVCSNDFRPGYTIPYTAPEVFHDNAQFDQKCDVFSLGVLIHQLLFKKDQCFLYNNETFIIKNLKQTLANLYIKCISINKNQRPYLDWILIQLRQSINYLDKIF